MIEAFSVLLLCQLAGETAQRLLALPVPGPVIGLVLLATVLALRGEVPGQLGETADGILRHLSLMFVPAGVGIVEHLDLVARHGVRLIIVVVVSTALAIAATALTFQVLSRRFAAAGEERGAP